MLPLVVLVYLISSCLLVKSSSPGDGDAVEGDLINVLRNDANLDLSVDEEYEDLRAELLAYHTALATLTSESSRRSMLTTPCWSLGGICINHKLCTGLRYMTEVPGCKDKSNVCCFAWNRFKVRDMRDKGLSVLAMPWSNQQDFGGKGILDPEPVKKPKKNKKRKLSASNGTRSLAVIIKTKK